MVPGSRSGVPGRRTANGWLGVKRHCHRNGLPEAGGCRKARSGGSHGAADQWHLHPGDSHEDTKARSLEKSAQSLGVLVASCESCHFFAGPKTLRNRPVLFFVTFAPEPQIFSVFRATGHLPSVTFRNAPPYGPFIGVEMRNGRHPVHIVKEPVLRLATGWREA